MALLNNRKAMWWTASIALHLLILLLFAIPGVRKWVFGGDEAYVPPDATPAEIQKALDQLMTIWLGKMKKSEFRLAQLAEEIRGIGDAKHKKLVSRDAKPKPASADGGAPPEKLADAPLPTFVQPEREGVKDWDIYRVYLLCRAQESFVNDLASNVEAAHMSLVTNVALSKALVETRKGKPSRREIDVFKLTRPIMSVVRDRSYAEYKQELIDTELEVGYMVTACEEIASRMREIGQNDGLVTRAASVQVPGGGDNEMEARPYVGAPLLPEELFPCDLKNQIPLDAIKPVFANKIINDNDDSKEPGGEEAIGKWMSINTWWMIGPFTHPGRTRPSDLDKKYPPEANVDLDASYIGKKGRELRWKYFTTRFIKLEPQGNDNDTYSIWYYYTDIHSDKDQRLWVSFGSDDYSVAWLNEKLVWQSSKQPQHWTAMGQKMQRRLEFKKGINRLLVKLENAGGTTGLSVIINIDPEYKGVQAAQ